MLKDEIKDTLGRIGLDKGRYNVHGVEVCFYTNVKQCLDEANRNYGFFSGQREGLYRLNSYFLIVPSIDPFTEKINEVCDTTIAHNMVISTERNIVSQFFKTRFYGAVYFAESDEEYKTLDVFCIYQLNFLFDLVIRKNLLKNRVHSFYTRVIRRILHFPIFFLLSGRGINVLHGSVVEADGKGVAFLGLNKAGKSSLASFLVMQKGFHLVSNNFILVDRDFFYAFPEGKGDLDEMKRKIAVRARPLALFLLYRGCDRTLIKRVSPRKTLQKMLRSLKVSEMAYGDFVSLFDYLPEPPKRDFAFRFMEDLLKEVPAYDLCLSDDYSDVTEAITTRIDKLTS